MTLESRGLSPYGYRLQKADLTNSMGGRTDIRDMIRSIEIYEGIDSPFITGKLMIYDGIGLFENFPLIGEERFCLFFHSENVSQMVVDQNFLKLDTMRKEFDIIGVDKVEAISPVDKVVTLLFASKELKRSLMTKVSRTFKNMPISRNANNSSEPSIVRSLMTSEYPFGLEFRGDIRSFGRFLKTDRDRPSLFFTTHVLDEGEDNAKIFYAHDTEYREYYTVPYLNPLEAVSRQTKKAVYRPSSRIANSNRKDCADFFFFENTRGFNFVSLTGISDDYGLYREASKEELKRKLPVLFYGTPAIEERNESNSTDTQAGIDFTGAEIVMFQNIHNKVNAIKNGHYASILMAFNPITGMYSQGDETGRGIGAVDPRSFKSNYKWDAAQRFISDRSSRQMNEFPPFSVGGVASEQGHFFNETTNENNDMLGRHYSKMVYRPFMRGLYEVEGDEIDQEEYVPLDSWALTRPNLKKILDDCKCTIKIPGNTFIKAGDYIYFEYWSADKNGNVSNPVENENYSGVYLVTSIKHDLTQTDYGMILDIVKDSVIAAIGDRTF